MYVCVDRHTYKDIGILYDYQKMKSIAIVEMTIIIIVITGINVSG